MSFIIIAKFFNSLEIERIRRSLTQYSYELASDFVSKQERNLWTHHIHASETSSDAILFAPNIPPFGLIIVVVEHTYFWKY